jgi:hypothetical protein
MNKKTFTAELNDAILKALMFESHKSYRALAREFGVGLSYVTDMAKNNGISRPRGPKSVGA